jgi:hypothetical protein
VHALLKDNFLIRPGRYRTPYSLTLSNFLKLSSGSSDVEAGEPAFELFITAFIIDRLIPDFST